MFSGHMLTDPQLNSFMCCVSKTGIAFACDIWLGWVFQVIGFPGVAMVKNLPASAGDARDMGSSLGCDGPLG